MIPHKVKLSGELSSIAEVIGFGNALKLASEFGGTEIKIPKHPRKGQQLVDCIGLDAAIKLSKAYLTGKMEIPLGPSGTYNQFIRSQSQRIQKALETNKNNVQIAREVGCTTRTVRKHKNGTSDPDSPTLFD
tara:strand:+ start:12243 stop:12638 length:396 start_codon:yes stop_codon:yes gene_type:complete